MLALVLALVIACVVAGIIGFVVHGLFWLFVIACALFVVTVLAGAFRRGRRSAGRSR
jgi:predicted ABC-type sugar transport system permease subunit